MKLVAQDYSSLKWNVSETISHAATSKFTTTVWREEKQHQQSLKIQHSGESGDFTEIPKVSLNTFALGIYKADCRTQDKATDTIRKIGKALEGVSYRRSLYGSYQNRLEHTVNNVKNTQENIESAESRIRDTNMSEEMVHLSKHNILEQAGLSILAQCSRQPEAVLSLLQ